jgi:regulatory protein
MSSDAGDGSRQPTVSAFDAACRYLASRERATSQVRDYLRRKGYDTSAIQEALERMIGRGFLDDERFARLYIESRTRRSPRSGALLVRELLTRGVDREIAQRVVRAFLEAMPEEDLARRALDRIPIGGDDPERAVRRLRSRGFRGGLSLRVIREKAGEKRDDEVQEA